MSNLFYVLTIAIIRVSSAIVNNTNGAIKMNNKQLEVMKLSINPTKKLFMLAMLEVPDANRKRLAEFMNCDATHVSTVTKKLASDGLISVTRKDDTASVKYEVLV